MDYATLRLTIAADGSVTARLAAPDGVAPYDLAVIADDLADAINAGGLTALRDRIKQIERERHRERPG